MAIDYTKFIAPLKVNIFGCDLCGTVYRARGNCEAFVCPDCGLHFCRTCVEKGMVPKHVCVKQEEE